MQNRQERFMVSHEEKEHGPFTREEIAARLKSGEFSVIDFVYVEAQSDWITLLEFCPDVNPTPQPVEKVASAATVAPSVAAPIASSIMAPTALSKISEPVAPVKESKPEAKVETKHEPKVVPLEKLELKGGLGTIDLVQFSAGQVRLSVQGALESPQPIPLTVKAAPAEKLVLKGPSEGTAGESYAFHMEAADKFGNRDASFSGSVTVALSGSAQGGGVVRFKDGQAKFEVTNKVAEKVSVKLNDSEKTGLDVSAIATLSFNAAKAARLILVAPQEAVAGQPVKVTVKAVDAFGNLATQFGGEVKLEVDAANEAKKASAS